MSGRGWTRRAFLKAAAVSGAAASLPAAARLSAQAGAPKEVFRVGFLVPGAGRLAEAGEAAARGAELGIAEAAHLGGLFAKGFELVGAAAADAQAARREALRLIEEERVFAVAGGLDDASCAALAELADRQEVPFFNLGCAEDAFRGAGCRRYAFHVEASVGMYADALAAWLVEKAGLRRWHFVSAASERGAAAYRRAARALQERSGEEVGHSSVPSEASEHSAPLKALREARPDVVLVALEGAARESFLRRYRQANLPFEVAVLLPEDAAPWTIPADARFGIRPVLWHPKLFKYGADQLNDRYSRRFGRPFDARGWAAWVGVKILAETVLRAGGASGRELVRHLERRGTQFDGQKGKPLTFRPWDHQLRQPVYLVRAKPEAPGPQGAFEHLAELPLGEPGPQETSREFLDRLGDTQEESPCRFPEA